MRILILFLFTFNLYAQDSKVDNTRLRMEMDFLQSGSDEEASENLNSDSEIAEVKPRLKFQRAKKTDPEILPLDSNFDRVQFKTAAPVRKATTQNELEEEMEENPTSNKKVNQGASGNVPKDIFED